jgi:rhodanese-related sulfurtransferase
MNQVIQISPQEAYKYIGQGAILIDVRERDEIKEIACDTDTIHIPMSQFQLQAQSIPKDKIIITLCYSGGRSFVASQLLQAYGFKNIFNIEGGIVAWKNAGLPIK